MIEDALDILQDEIIQSITEDFSGLDGRIMTMRLGFRNSYKLGKEIEKQNAVKRVSDFIIKMFIGNVLKSAKIFFDFQTKERESNSNESFSLYVDVTDESCGLQFPMVFSDVRQVVKFFYMFSRAFKGYLDYIYVETPICVQIYDANFINKLIEYSRDVINIPLDIIWSSFIVPYFETNYEREKALTDLFRRSLRDIFYYFGTYHKMHYRDCSDSELEKVNKELRVIIGTEIPLTFSDIRVKSISKWKYNESGYFLKTIDYNIKHEINKAYEKEKFTIKDYRIQEYGSNSNYIRILCLLLTPFFVKDDCIAVYIDFIINKVDVVQKFNDYINGYIKVIPKPKR